MTGSAVKVVRQVAGEDGVHRLLTLAGETRPVADLEDHTAWCSYDEGVRLFEAAVVVTGDPDVARRIGEDTLSQYAGTEVAALLRSLGSPGELLRNVATTAAKYSTAIVMDAVVVEGDRAVVRSTTVAPHVRHPLFCHYTAGLLSQASPLFGLDPAVVEEVGCEVRGDPACVYEVTWDHHGSDGAERRAEHLATQLASLTARFESLQATATQIVDADGVEEVLAAITDRAELAVRAPQFLLAVRLAPGEPLRVHHRGFDSDGRADAMAHHLVDGESDHVPSHLVVDVASRRRRFGVLAALYPSGQQFFPQERQMLGAYGGFAAAALEAAASLEEARRQNTTARVLLRLGRALARVQTTDELVARLIEAVPQVVACRSASVFLWDDDRSVLCLRGATGLPADVAGALEGLEVSLDDTPALEAMVREPAPLYFDGATTDPFLRALIEVARISSSAVVPITSHGEFLGTVVVGRHETDRPDADFTERLTGMADQAATALLNGRLLETIRQQALHDTLTGLPNARLLADRAATAIAQAQRNGTSTGLLFIDLDRFKPVNDTYGHAVGDLVLRATADRLRGTLRSGDTVGRLGGDEFVVLLPELTSRDDAVAAAERVLRALDAPLEVDGFALQVSSSVGIALTPGHGTAFEDLLRHADAAMYTAKTAGAGTFRLPTASG